MKRYLLIFLTLALCTGAYLYVGNSPENIEIKRVSKIVSEEYDESRIVKTIAVDAMVVSFENTEDLISNSELVIVGNPLKSENYVTKDSEGFLEHRFTITEVKLTNVYEDKTGKNYSIGDIIKVAEPMYFIDNGDTGLIKYTINDYKDMNKEEEYLLVLKEDIQFNNLYVLLGMDEGKYSISLLRENSHTDKTKIEQFRFELFERYNIN